MMVAIPRLSKAIPVVPEDELQRLLQPFQRLSPDHNDGHGHGLGLGLGLAIVTAITHAHDATLTARPRPEGAADHHRAIHPRALAKP
jgi:signal transduction histidine kinase